MKRTVRVSVDWITRYWHKNWSQKVVIVLIVFIALSIGTMYGIARWYMWTQRNMPLTIGMSFIPDYAKSFGLDPQETMDAFIDELGVRRFRLVGYWNKIERQQGVYDFNELDWQFTKVNDAGGTVSLSIGLRQPRWPECHMPEWAMSQPKEVWAAELKDFMGAVIARYKDNPALESYQLENEYFLKVFGICPDHSRDRLIDEYWFVKSLDPDTPVIISRSNNAIGMPLNEPTPDKYAVSVYKRVWDINLTKRYVEYPFPAWFYGFLAGSTKIVQGKDTFIHELQAEPWPPRGKPIVETPIEEQDKSLNAARLKHRFEYGSATGMKNVDLWGAEWWYWRKEKANDPSLWNTAKEAFQKNDHKNN